MGQKQTFAVHQLMSGLPPKADVCNATKNVRYGPKADIRLKLMTLFNQLVGADEQGQRDGQAKSLPVLVLMTSF